MTRPFQGTINLALRDSTETWTHSCRGVPPRGAPNVLVVADDQYLDVERQLAALLARD